MPIVDVEFVTDSGGSARSGLAQSLADAIGRTLKSPHGQTWVRLHVLAREHYAENESRLETNELPVFVVVLMRTIPKREELAREILALADAIAQVTGRDMSNVHIEYAPSARGRLGFGGHLVE